MSNELQEKFGKKIEGRLVKTSRERKSRKDELNKNKLFNETKVTFKNHVNVISVIEDLYRKEKMVHVDFFKYNIFKTKKELEVFEFGSVVDIRHPSAIEFLERDIKNITRFLIKRGLTIEHMTDIIMRIIR